MSEVMWNASVGRKMHTGFWWGNLKEQDCWEI